MVLDFVYHWIIHLRRFHYFVRLARIKILNQFQFVELLRRNDTERVREVMKSTTRLIYTFTTSLTKNNIKLLLGVFFLYTPRDYTKSVGLNWNL